jgi:hypothetical protein
MSQNWIECGLPWRNYEFPNLDAPDLQEEMRADFGETFDEVVARIDFDLITGIKEDISADLVDAGWDPNSPEFEKEVQLQYEKEMRRLGNDVMFKDNEKRRTMLEWRRDHPKLLVFNQECARLNEELNRRCFKGAGLALPGTQIEIEGGKRLLIGDINPLGGICDDCAGIDDDTIIVRYRVFDLT